MELTGNKTNYNPMRTLNNAPGRSLTLKNFILNRRKKNSFALILVLSRFIISLVEVNSFHIPYRRTDVVFRTKRGDIVVSKAQKDTRTTKEMETRKHLVLVGGGHAHLQVIKAFNAASRPANLDVTLVDMQENASYSGMVPGKKVTKDHRLRL